MKKAPHLSVGAWPMSSKGHLLCNTVGKVNLFTHQLGVNFQEHFIKEIQFLLMIWAAGQSFANLGQESVHPLAALVFELERIRNLVELFDKSSEVARRWAHP